MAATTTGGFALEHTMLTSPPTHIPDGNGGTYKSELVLFRDPDPQVEVSTEKLLWWHADDPREDPHNHPWDFTSTILHGGYTEERFWLDADGTLQSEVLTHVAGETNTVPISVFHNVRHVKPETVTRMVCGPAVPGNTWSYLNVDTLDQVHSGTPEFQALNPEFVAQLHTVNPFLRK